jgi:hypothetical protein
MTITRITFNPIHFSGCLLAWHWFGWRWFVVCLLLSSGIGITLKEAPHWLSNLILKARIAIHRDTGKSIAK